jgi:hypothetical protein
MARPRDFAVSPKSCPLLPLSSESPGYLVTGVADAGAAVSDRGYNKRGENLRDVALTLCSRSRREPQKSGQNIATKAPIVSIETRMSSHELACGGAERWTCGFTRRPKTRRKLSGWSSKTRMCRIFLRAAFGAARGCPERKSNGRLDSLMTKIFFARMPGGRLTGKGRVKFG